MENNPPLHFDLQKQKLIEMIKQNKIEDAIKFAQERLFPIIQNNDKLLVELEKIMSLLAYDDINKSPFKDLATEDQLKKLASILNLEILSAQMQPTDILLPTILKILKWTQGQLKSEIKFPELTNICPLKFNKPE